MLQENFQPKITVKYLQDLNKIKRKTLATLGFQKASSEDFIVVTL